MGLCAMIGPRLLDAVTLRHFGVTEHMGVLKHLLSACPAPYWTDAVRGEILAGIGQPDCNNVLSASFLGRPHQILIADMVEVMRIRIALSDRKSRPAEHLGEAESIFLADKLNGSFITDDFAAYELASRRLGDCRVLDTVDLLRETVVTGYFTASEAQQVADAIRNNGRRLRRGHPLTFTAKYFEP
jgi:predicted nucleic acid-binding protein